MELIQKVTIQGDKDKQVDKIVGESTFDVLNIQLKKGEEIPTHNSDRNVMVVVRKGIVSFTIEGETVELTNENVLRMTPLENHSLVAVEDADILVFKIK